MTKMEERVMGLEKELEGMRNLVSRLHKEKNDQIEIISRLTADVVELQEAIKQVKAQLKVAGSASYENRVTRYE